MIDKRPKNTMERIQDLQEELEEEVKELQQLHETKPYDEGYNDGCIESKEVMINKLKKIV